MKFRNFLVIGLIIAFVIMTNGIIAYASYDLGEVFTDALFSTDSIIFQGGNSKVIGNAGTNGDNVIIDKANVKISGDLFIGPDSTSKPEWASRVTGQVLNLDEERNFELPELSDFPVLTSKGSIVLNGNRRKTIVGDGKYEEDRINGNGALTIETNTAHITGVVINKLSGSNIEINITGGGKLYLYINQMSSNGNRLDIRNNGSNNDCYAIVNSVIGSDTLVISGNSMSKCNFILNVPKVAQRGNSRIIGNILFTGSDYSMDGNSSIEGLIYAPRAELFMGGNSNIKGGVIIKDYLSKPSNSKIQMNLPGSFIIPEDLAVFPTATEEPIEDPEEPIEDPEEPTPIPEGDRVLMGFPYAYMYGYEHGDVGADDYIKREEASTLIYRLIKQNNKLNGFVRPSTATFTDVPTSSWAFSAIEFMTYIGVFDNTKNDVAPLHEMTRGEVAKIITFSLRIRPDDSKDISFDDLPENNRHYECIKALVDEGVLIGYHDNTIRPDDKITRAEFITIFNRIIGRDDDRYDISGQERIYPDLDESHWAYGDIMRASFGFSDQLNEEGKYEVDPSRKPSRYEIDYN